MGKILVATDGSENANRALLEAKKTAEAFNADIVILTVLKGVVVTSSMTRQHYAVESYESVGNSGEDLLEEAKKLFDDFPGEVQTELEIGIPGDEIIKEIQREEYDLVVMGSRGLGAITRTLLGSISHKVLNNVETDILIVQ